MLIVGLTGGIATGKSTVLSIFRDNGISVIDADDVARKVVLPGTLGYKQIKEYFGDEVFQADGNLDRKALGQLIFNDVGKRRKLNEITHSKIQFEIMVMAFKEFMRGTEILVVELPLLFETRKMINFLYTIVTVHCSEEQQLLRLQARDDYCEKIALQRIKTQMPIDDKIDMSNFAIDNSGDLENTKTQTKKIIRVLKMSNFTSFFRVAVIVGLLGTFAAFIWLFMYVFEGKI